MKTEFKQRHVSHANFIQTAFGWGYIVKGGFGKTKNHNCPIGENIVLFKSKAEYKTMIGAKRAWFKHFESLKA
jgi:hypothetical protein